MFLCLAGGKVSARCWETVPCWWRWRGEHTPLSCAPARARGPCPLQEPVYGLGQLWGVLPCTTCTTGVSCWRVKVWDSSKHTRWCSLPSTLALSNIHSPPPRKVGRSPSPALSSLGNSHSYSICRNYSFKYLFPPLGREPRLMSETIICLFL